MTKTIEDTLLSTAFTLIVGAMILMAILGKAGAGFEVLMIALGAGMGSGALTSIGNRRAATREANWEAAVVATATDNEVD